MDNLKILFRLYRQYTKMDLLWFLRDTRYCLLQIVSDTICACCTIAGVFLLSEKFGGFGGMNQAEILFMMGFSTLVDGIYMMFFIGNNTAMISRIIGRGQLDHVMIQPVPIWAELLAQGFSPLSGSSMLICGIGLTTYAVSRLPISVTMPWLMLLLIYALSATALIISFMTLLSCAAFYAPAAAEEIAQVGKDLFTSLKTYPLGTMSHSVRRLFLTVLPVGLAAWFPSALLLKAGCGEFGLPMLLQACYLPTAAFALSLLTIYVFKKGMKYYAVNGSPRYSGFGHR